MNERIGFMQGRMTPLVNGKIQTFPWDTWRDEFCSAKKISIKLMEWTLDQERLYENPIMTIEGQVLINNLAKENDLSIPSLTGDCFMQEPFWKCKGKISENLENDFISITKAAANVGVTMLVIPLVDNGRIENYEQEKRLLGFLKENSRLFELYRMKIIFESDFEPINLARFIDYLEPEIFGINYDIGNSAALGFDCKKEIKEFGHRIDNVHIKDRVLGGTTVPLGSGNAKFNEVFDGLAKNSYKGNFILQTARADDGDHIGAIEKYRDMVLSWILKYGF
jgi:L-ribulose-5-phosphate 3-epimerase